MTCVTISPFALRFALLPLALQRSELHFGTLSSDAGLSTRWAIMMAADPAKGEVLRAKRLANSRNSGKAVKIAVRVAVFALGVVLIAFGVHKSRSEMMVFQNNPSTPTSTYSPEIIAVAGAFIALGAFAPSPATLGRWMSLKRRKPVPHAHFRRQRRS